MRPMSRGAGGFTLIELIVVVAILTLLVTVIVPRVIVALGDSRRSEALATASVIANGMSRYFVEHRTYPSGSHDPEELVNWSDADSESTLGEHLALRNPESIATMTVGSGSISSSDTNVSPLPVIGDEPHDWWIVLTFSDAVCKDGHDAECVITPEAIRWRGQMQ